MYKRLLLAFALSMTSIFTSLAGGPTFYYKFVVKPATTGEGKVYASNQDETPASSKYKDYYGTTVYEEGTTVNVAAATVTAFLYAQPSDGYMFTHWARVEDNDKEVIFSHSKNATDLVTTKATTIQDPKISTYKAYFAKIGLVYPASSDESLGTVSIDIPSNDVGDVVTMTATPDMLNGIFKGWQRNNSTRLIYDNPLIVDVSKATKGTYTAIFEEKGIDSKGLYVRLENLGTGSYLGVIGSSENTMNSDQRYFNNSLMLVSKKNPLVNTIPSLILKLTGNSTGTAGLENVEMVGQGISTYKISSRKFRIEKYLENDYFFFGNHNGFTGYIKDNNDSPNSTMELIGTIHHPSLWNRPNDNKRYRWAVHIIDEENFDTEYFGAMPSEKTFLDGKYYTTMYTSFPYECRDGVKPYIVDKILPDGKAHMVEVSEDIVPAYTPVILECNSTNPKENRLMPLLYDPLPVTTSNLLKGELWLNDDSGDEDNYRTTFDATKLRVLSNDKPVFASVNNYDPNNASSRLKYIANNTCYLDISGVTDPAEEIELTKERDTAVLKGDANGDGSVNVGDIMLCVNYILRREVKMFFFDNADTNSDGDITVGDVMWIVNYILGRIK